MVGVPEGIMVWSGSKTGEWKSDSIHDSCWRKSRVSIVGSWVMVLFGNSICWEEMGSGLDRIDLVELAMVLINHFL